MSELPLKDAYVFARKHGLEEKILDIRRMRPRNPYARRGHIIRLFEDKNILQDFLKECWSFGTTQAGQSKRLRYLSSIDENANESELDEVDEAEAAEDLSFALEANLRDFLANNLTIIEPGLHLYKNNGSNGIEFSIDNGRGRLDILAIGQDGKYVVIELKLSQGRNKALGQLLYYMSWVDKNLGDKEPPCRGMIIAKEINEDLSLAVSRVPGVSLKRYSMSFTIEDVTQA